ncbi:MAG TPA: HAD family hydrolase [Verrucomicrobiales bacterium]|nr:HAD family hydrolase [Verrucomicrobiales bacterium]
MSFQAVVFDLDGTLLDTLEDLARSSNQVLEDHGFPVYPMEKYRFFVGDGVRTLVERILPEDRRDDVTVSECVASFRRIYKDNWDQSTCTYEGIGPMLDDLSKKQIRMAVLSNKPDDFTKKCVSRFLNSWNFDPVVGQTEEIPKKPDPVGALSIASAWGIIPEKILYLGDTSVDMKTAVRAGMMPVGALWGFRTAEELKENGARRLLRTPGELMEML